MNDFSFVRYLPKENNLQLTAQLVECYRAVFAGEPWGEWLKCSKCQRRWGIEDAAYLVSLGFCHCNVPLVDFWPREQVVADLYHEITPEASCWLAMNQEGVAGFCWGYPMTVGDLEKKINISLDNGHKLKTGEVVAYQDEVGVISTCRGRKIAKALVTRQLNDFLAQGLRLSIVRTRQHPEPSKVFLWYTKKLGYEIIATYPNDDGRVILSHDLKNLTLV